MHMHIAGVNKEYGLGFALAYVLYNPPPMLVALFHAINRLYLPKRRRNQPLVIAEIAFIFQPNYVYTAFKKFI